MVKVDGSKAGDTHRHLRQGGLGVLDAHRPDGPRRVPRRPPGLRRPRSRTDPDYPVLQDLIAVMRPSRRRPGRVRRLRRAVVLRGGGARVPLHGGREGRPRGRGRGWEVRATLRNDGTGTMPLEVAAARGDRIDKDGKPETRTTAMPGSASPSARARSSRSPSAATSSPTGSCPTQMPGSSSSSAPARCAGCKGGLNVAAGRRGVHQLPSRRAMSDVKKRIGGWCGATGRGRRGARSEDESGRGATGGHRRSLRA